MTTPSMVGKQVHNAGQQNILEVKLFINNFMYCQEIRESTYIKFK